jgi:hypothetical protein
VEAGAQTNGLLMFSCFGPDTLKELRAAAACALPHSRPMPFVDMHDFGDMMVASGLRPCDGCGGYYADVRVA